MEEALTVQTNIEQSSKQIEAPKKEPIIGVEILRFYMALMVVCAHLGGTLLLKWAGIFYIFQPFHVPTFMLLSFLLCAKYFLAPTKKLVIKRLLRILIPFIAWGILSYFLSLILWPISLLALLNQLFTGYPLNNALWYLATTLWICLLFWLIKLLTPNNKIFIIVISILSLCCIVLQYTGLNYFFFNGLPYNIKFTIGRSFEMIPYATLGIVLSLTLPYLNKLNHKSHLIMFLGSIILMSIIIVFRNYVITYRPKGFDFPGASLIVVASLLVLSAYTNPINLIKNEKFRTIIKWLTSFTLGIYCMHVVIGRFVEWLFIAINWETYTTLMAVTTYLICYLISFLIYLVPNKYVRQLVS